MARAPEGMDESQVFTLPVFSGVIDGGNLDGAAVTVSAWMPTQAELEKLNKGQAIYILFVGGCPAHAPSVGFPMGLKS